MNERGFRKAGRAVPTPDEESPVGPADNDTDSSPGEWPEGVSSTPAAAAVPPTVRSPRRRVVATLPDVEHLATPFPDEHLVSLVDRESFAAEQYQILRGLIQRNTDATGLKVLAVTSPGPGDGKTLTSLNIAGALARNSRIRVLVIDGDLRRPAVLARLGVPVSGLKGLAEILTDPAVAFEVAVRYASDFNLFVLHAGASPQAPYEVLTSPHAPRLLNKVRKYFNYVILDTPPAVGFPDFRLLERWADGSLLVVGAGGTPREIVKLALDVVDRKKTIGIVFNRADVRRVASYYDNYYKKKRPSS
jgi:capsular exopolysaccharide synthesis family protein